jgi:LytR cell envelope-related transcriptional attenuator
LERVGRAGLIAALLALVAVGAGWWIWRRPAGSRSALVIPGADVHATVEVLNGTEIDGLAREVTRRLRRAGIDVVNFGSGTDTTLDSTTILVRRGDSTAALRVRRALGLGRVLVRPDPRLLLDVSVLVGQDLAAALGFHP